MEKGNAMARIIKKNREKGSSLQSGAPFFSMAPNLEAKKAGSLKFPAATGAFASWPGPE